MKTAFDLKDQTVMVTGGCGFIGHHLVEQLEKKNPKQIYVVDNLSTGDIVTLAGRSERVQILRQDFGHVDETLRNALRATDMVFHLAAVKHHQTLSDPERCLEVNINGTKRLLEACGECGVKKVVFSSSLYAYGRWSGPPMHESEVPHPNTVYGISKIAGEHLLSWMHQKYETPYVALRYFFTYGPGQFVGLGYPSVIYRNFLRMLKNEAPVIVGDGKQVLDYLYVEDMVGLTIQAMEAELSPQTFNVGSGRGTSILELTALMSKIADGKEPVFTDPDATHGSHRVADLSAAQKIFNFRPTTSLEEGLTSTYEWMKKRA